MNEFDRTNVGRKKEERERKKKILIFGMIICIIIIIVLAFLILLYQKKDAHTFKLYINDAQVQVSEGFYYTDEAGNIYVRAKEIAELIGLSYQNGEYGSFTEESTSGYVSNKYEVASFVSNSNILKKYINVTAVEYENEEGETVAPFQTNSPDDTLETITLELPITINESGDIYFPLKCLPEICCAGYEYSNPYRMYIYNQEHLINLAQIKAAEYGYENISGIYENMRLLAYNQMVVSDGNMYGVVELYSGESILGLKYTDMVFLQNVKEYFVKTKVNGEESIGIISMDGKQIISPKNYSNIQVLNDDLGLYLVEKDEKYGVLNRTGEVIVHCENDSIGIPEELIEKFGFGVEDNKYILFNNTIVVEDAEKFGLYSIRRRTNSSNSIYRIRIFS